MFIDFAVDGVLAVRAKVRGAALPIHKDSGIGNGFPEVAGGLNVDLERRRESLLNPSQGVVERRAWRVNICGGPRLTPYSSFARYVLLVGLLCSIQDESQCQSDGGNE